MDFSSKREKNFFFPITMVLKIVKKACYDTTDHYQDGYYTVPFDRFFSMWREGAAPEGRELWQQPFIVAAPAQD
jgi:hypothetical protein